MQDPGYKIQDKKRKIQDTGYKIQDSKKRKKVNKSKPKENLNRKSCIFDRVSGVVVSVNISERKTVRKKPVGECKLLEEHGFEKDAHAGDWHRQVSLLALESIEKMCEMGLDVGPGDFAENITTKGIELLSLPIGTLITIGDDILLEVTQIGKVCHTKCAIYYQAGDCIMPKEGIFARVIKGGDVKVGDRIRILDSEE
jgi:MOSC domain-containing protein YiiM